MSEVVRPPGWNRPSGYSDAIVASGRTLSIAGQIGFDTTGKLVSPNFAEQAAQALQNIADIVAAAGAKPNDVVRLTWYVTDLREYRAALSTVGQAYRRLFAGHYPAMTLLEVSALLEEGAKVEIEATAIIANEASH